MRRGITVLAVLALGGCGVGVQRAAERAAPELAFQGPIRSTGLTSTQVKQVRASIAKSLKDPASAEFGSSYKAGIGHERETVVCGFVNGKRFVGMFAKPKGGVTEFLPIRIATTEEEQEAVRSYCRADGIYLPR